MAASNAEQPGGLINDWRTFFRAHRASLSEQPEEALSRVNRLAEILSFLTREAYCLR